MIGTNRAITKSLSHLVQERVYQIDGRCLEFEFFPPLALTNFRDRNYPPNVYSNQRQVSILRVGPAAHNVGISFYAAIVAANLIFASNFLSFAVGSHLHR